MGIVGVVLFSFLCSFIVGNVKKEEAPAVSPAPVEKIAENKDDTK